jgi:tetratricopeptide (TPR) repeat protein
MSGRRNSMLRMAAGLGRCLAGAALLGSAPAAMAVDMVTSQTGETIRGSLVGLAPDTVEIEDRTGVRKLSIVDIRVVSFDGEPDSLRSARGLLVRRDARGAVEELEKIEGDELAGLEPRLREEYDYLKLAAAGRAASTAAEAAAVEEPLAAFLGRNTRTHHFYDGHKLLGDLRALQGKFAPAAEAYAALDRGPAAIQVRAAAAKAALFQQQGKYAEAIKEFEAAEKVKTSAEDTASAIQKREAALGKARCLALSGKAAEGIAVADGVIRASAPGDKELLATAYTVLGSCQRAAGGKDDDAVISFLTVDLVHNLLPAAHAEALYNLVELWNAANQPERAREAAQALSTNYPQSPWAAKLAGGGKAS